MEKQAITDIEGWDRIYRPGVEIRAYPVAKWEHAWSLARQLRSDYNDYRAALREETTPDMSPDRRSITFRARIEHQPPLEAWTLAFGDALHNYRSALDGLAWELANLDGRTVAPEHERSLYFPLALSEKSWEKLKRTTLASMPAVVLDRLSTVQPYRFEPVEEGIGLLLNKMSNLDKHRAGLSLELRVVDKTTFSIEFTPEDPNASHDYEYEFLAPDRSIRNGDVVFAFREREPVKSARVDKLPMILGVEIDGRGHNVFELLDMIERQVAGTFINACVGMPSGAWAKYLMEGGGRPETAWYPNLARYSAEMRQAALSLE